MAERLQKILANTGLGSRRELESWISDGQVRLNGREAKLGDRAALDDDLTVKGRFYRVVADESASRRVLMYHKPLGELTTRDDPEKRRTVFDRLPNLHQGRWIAVGRLDINTLGLLLLTNDGQLANTLMHPSGNYERHYAVRVNGQVSSDMLTRLRSNVDLEDGPAHFDRLVAEGAGEGSNQWYKVSVKEGRNRLVRRLWESQDVKVSRLIRTRYGPVALPRWLSRGKLHEMPATEVAELAKASGLPPTPADKLRVVPLHPRHKRRSQKRRRSTGKS
ncbi:MAG: pseudouridine synthase [Granulosicoccus sp.]